jgi:hypothetical protein
MAEEANMQESIQDSSAEQTAGDSQTQEQSTGSEAQEQGQQESGDQSKQSADASTGEQKPSENKEAKQEFKPVSRRSAAYRIQQLTKQVNDLKKSQQGSAQDDEGDEYAGDDPKPDLAALVAAEVEKRLHPVMSEHTKTADDSEINEFFSGDKAAEKAKYEEQIRNAWKLDQYKDLAASDLYKIFTYEDAIANAKAQAVEEYKKAEKEAKELSASASGNTSNRTGTSKSLAEMTDEELVAHNERVKLGKT